MTPLGGSSSLCLSCHDGTVAVGQTQPYGQQMMTGSMNTTDVFGATLQGSHPFSLKLPLLDADLNIRQSLQVVATRIMCMHAMAAHAFGLPLDVTREAEWIEAVKKIKAMGISLLIAASNLTTASRIADRLYAIDRGEIIFEGDPRSASANEDVMKTLRG